MQGEEKGRKDRGTEKVKAASQLGRLCPPPGDPSPGVPQTLTQVYHSEGIYSVGRLLEKGKALIYESRMLVTIITLRCGFSITPGLTREHRETQPRLIAQPLCRTHSSKARAHVVTRVQEGTCPVTLTRASCSHHRHTPLAAGFSPRSSVLCSWAPRKGRVRRVRLFPETRLPALAAR